MAVGDFVGITLKDGINSKVTLEIDGGTIDVKLPHKENEAICNILRPFVKSMQGVAEEANIELGDEHE